MRDSSCSPLCIAVAIGGISLSLPVGCIAGLSGLDVAPNARQAMLVGAATVGWSFTANSDLTVTELGYFDYGGNGLGEAHPVGIWDDTGNLLGSTTVQTNGTLIGGFRYASVPAIALESGRNYVIAGFQSNESLASRIDGLATGNFSAYAGITYGNSLMEFTPVFSRPGYDLINIGAPAIGPNFRATESATIAPVPEPGTAVCGFALAMVGLIGRRRSRGA